jgi:hypothetical protein
MGYFGSCSRAPPGSQIRTYLPHKAAAAFEKIDNDYIITLVGVLKNTEGCNNGNAADSGTIYTGQAICPGCSESGS